MAKGFWYVALSLVVANLAAHAQSSKIEQARIHKPSHVYAIEQRPLTAVSPRPREMSAAKKDQDCNNEKENRASDLCAQWKAADAAQGGTEAAWIFGTIGACIGSLTLIAAGLAARYARDAARENKRSADIAVRALALEQRPWLTFGSLLIKNSNAIRYVETGGIGLAITATVEVTNTGKEPPKHATLSYCFIRANPERFFTTQKDELKQGAIVIPLIMPGETKTLGLTIDIKPEEFAKEPFFISVGTSIQYTSFRSDLNAATSAIWWVGENQVIPGWEGVSHLGMAGPDKKEDYLAPGAVAGMQAKLIQLGEMT